MKRKINFDITVGSHWESNDVPEHMSDVRFPVGGQPKNQIIEFETDGKDPFKDACNALEEMLKPESYHIYYWTWLDLK